MEDPAEVLEVKDCFCFIILIIIIGQSASFTMRTSSLISHLCVSECNVFYIFFFSVRLVYHFILNYRLLSVFTLLCNFALFKLTKEML